jgi:hypothetical protein
VITAPATACVVRGLDNGTAYTFSVTAFNAAGDAESDTPSTPVTPEPSIDPAPMPLDRPLRPGQTQAMEDGKPVNVSVAPDRMRTGLTVSTSSFTLAVEGVDRRGNPVGLQNDRVLVMIDDGRARTTGEGFRPGSTVQVFLGADESSRTRSGIATSSMMSLGTVRVNDLGNFAGTVTLPANLKPGRYVLQVAGVTASNGERAVSLGVRVVEGNATLVLNQGKRSALKGKSDRIVTTGTSQGVPTGTKLTPYFRFGPRGEFQRGVATIKVQADGSFRWTRKVNRTKPMVAYVRFADATSNTVRWARIR